MNNLCELSEKLMEAFGIESMIEYVCRLSNDEILKVIAS